MDPSTSIEIAEVGCAFAGGGVLAFDLAGAEAGNPAHRHREAFRIAEEGGLGRTVHAGEAWGAESIADALDTCGAQRIGHGTRLYEDPALLRRVLEAQIPLEICLTSNVQTGASPSFLGHPVRSYFDQGLRLTLCTDNRLMSGVSLTEEYERASRELGFDTDALVRIARMGFESAFADEAVRSELLGAFDRETAGI